VVTLIVSRILIEPAGHKGGGVGVEATGGGSREEESGIGGPIAD
jgi:hypothetical protein